MTTRIDIDRNWSLLEHGAKDSGSLPGVPSLAVGLDCGHGQIRLALSRDGRRRLLMPVALEATAPNDIGGDGIDVVASEFVVSGVLTKFVDISCTDPTLNDVFTEVIGEILQRLARGTPPKRAVPEVLDEFRRLLRRRSASLNKETLLGLLGELLVLREASRLSPGAIESWHGPDGHRHDFSRSGVAIEVKSTLGREPYMVPVSSIDQLEAPPGGELFLAHAAFEETADGDMAFQVLVNDIVGAGVSRDHLEEKLAVLPLGDRDEASRFRAVLRRLAVFRVSDAFPRITPSSFREGRLPDGIAACRYVLDLSAARGSMLDEQSRDSVFERMGRP